MSLSSLRKLFVKSQLPVLAGVILVFGLFAVVVATQQRQDVRSRAAGHGGTGNCLTVNASSGEDLVGDNCTIDSGFNGSVIGNGNVIRGGLGGQVGNVIGNNNNIQGGVNGCIKGNDNLIQGGVNGGVDGTGNIIQGGQGSGACPKPTNPPTSTPLPTVKPPATCADGIDNNQNELIDKGDPACHTDGNQDNPNSYDPGRNEGPVSPTAPLARCSDNIDNDNNGFKDGLDSTCHTDNNPKNPNSYDPTRDGEHGGLNTCADSKDNNNNNVIDGGDPICHTDGNANNPDSYDPDRPEGGVTPGVTVTVAPTVAPTVTVAPGNTSVRLNLLLHGIGKAGDSANPNSGGNPNPLRPQRTATVQVFNSQNQLILTKQGAIVFGATAGSFTGTVDLGTTLTTGVYTIKVKTTQFLNTLVPGIQNLTQGTVNQLPSTVMVNGDIDGNNTLNILDYNILMGCYSDFLPAVSCTAANKPLSDLDDDGDVNQFDYNLFLREITNREGQ